MKHWTLLSLLSLWIAAPGFAQESAEKVLSDIHATNTAEIAFGTLAKQKGRSEQVRRYGDRLAKDHTKSDKKVKDLAKKKDITLADPVMMPEHRELFARLEAASGSEFDKIFLDGMEKAHNDAARKLRNTKVDDAEVQKFVNRLVPDLEKHEHMAHEIDDRLARR